MGVLCTIWMLMTCDLASLTPGMPVAAPHACMLSSLHELKYDIYRQPVSGHAPPLPADAGH